MRREGYEFGPVGAMVADEALREERSDSYEAVHQETCGSIAIITTGLDVMMDESAYGYGCTSTDTETTLTFNRNYIEGDGETNINLSVLKRRRTDPESDEQKHFWKVTISYRDRYGRVFLNNTLNVIGSQGEPQTAGVAHLMGRDNGDIRQPASKKFRLATQQDLLYLGQELQHIWDLQREEDLMQQLKSEMELGW